MGSDVIVVEVGGVVAGVALRVDGEATESGSPVWSAVWSDSETGSLGGSGAGVDGDVDTVVVVAPGIATFEFALPKVRAYIHNAWGESYSILREGLNWSKT